MGSMVFTKGADTFTFQHGRKHPVADPVKVNVVTGLSEGGQMYAYNKGITEQFFTLDFKNIGATDYGEIVDWLENIAVGPLNTFTFTDEAAANHTVRLIETEDPFKEVAHNIYTGRLTLREEI